MGSIIASILIIIGLIIVFATHIMILQAGLLSVQDAIGHANLNLLAGVLIVAGVLYEKFVD